MSGYSKQLITDISGSGNNWAVGHRVFGSLYREQILEKLRKSAEQCDCLRCFFIIHSMGGGTGSGFGTFLLKVLEDEFPEVYRFVTAVYPSGEDGVITSPYNSMLAMRELSEHADCVLPIDNQVRHGAGRGAGRDPISYTHSVLPYIPLYLFGILTFSS